MQLDFEGKDLLTQHLQKGISKLMEAGETSKTTRINDSVAVEEENDEESINFSDEDEKEATLLRSSGRRK